MTNLVSSESISWGHPDRLADTIANFLLNHVLVLDKESRAGIEVMLSKDSVILGGEIATRKIKEFTKDIDYVVRKAIKEVGYTKQEQGFQYSTVNIVNNIVSQSPDIAEAVVHKGATVGAGDQGIIFGYASHGSDQYLPIQVTLANTITSLYQDFIKSDKADGCFYPDAKSVVIYDNDSCSASSVVVAASNDGTLPDSKIKELIYKNVVVPAFVQNNTTPPSIDILRVNTSGKFVKHGPAADCGLTGRKLVVDSYGGAAHIGGGNTNGKDNTKVDTSAARAARHAAKNIVAAGLCSQCEIQLTYSIGDFDPIAIRVDTKGTFSHPDLSVEQGESILSDCLRVTYDFGVKALCKNFGDVDLRYITKSGQFMDNSYPWELLDYKEIFESYFKGCLHQFSF